jgi:hypothetical protein
MLIVKYQKHSIVTLDPFGYSDIDTTVNPKINEQNRLHLKTKKTSYKKPIAFQKNKPYTDLSIKESSVSSDSKTQSVTMTT